MLNIRTGYENGKLISIYVSDNHGVSIASVIISGNYIYLEDIKHSAKHTLIYANEKRAIETGEKMLDAYVQVNEVSDNNNNDVCECFLESTIREYEETLAV